MDKCVSVPGSIIKSREDQKMGKKYILMKMQKPRKLYLDDVLSVHSFQKRKTPKLPPYEDRDLSDTDPQSPQSAPLVETVANLS